MDPNDVQNPLSSIIPQALTHSLIFTFIVCQASAWTEAMETLYHGGSLGGVSVNQSVALPCFSLDGFQIISDNFS